MPIILSTAGQTYARAVGTQPMNATQASHERPSFGTDALSLMCVFGAFVDGTPAH
ncbi:MAG: hypothetical protein GY938_14185 [Ketobacter sp.]|nr:hypothetical protein [Ketobacter sp.]